MIRSNMFVPDFELPDGGLKFLSTQEQNYTYNNLYSFAAEFKTHTDRFNISADRPLLILSDSTDETVFAIAAAFLLKIPILTLHPDSTPFELEEVLNSIEPAAMYTSKIPKLEIFDEIPLLDVDFKSSIIKHPPGQEEIKLDEPKKIAGYFLTSGSAGSSKIVPIKRRQVFFAAVASAKNFKPGKNKFWLLCLPLNHVGGINVIYRSIFYHSAIYLVPSFDVDNVRKLLNENKKFEAASMVPTMLEKVLEHSFSRLQFNFKGLLLGGGPVSLDLINRSLTRGIPIVTSYGMTETCAQIAANPMLRPSGVYIPKKSVGAVFEPNEIQIRDENGDKLPYNESGLIWLRGPQVFDGYYDEDQNAEHFDDEGWFNTGDYGKLNRQDQLFVESRRTDLIITGGENVNPGEIEELLNGMDEIIESAVAGVPDSKWGQRVVAFLVTKENQIDLNQVEKVLKNSVRSFKIPKEFILVESLPKTETHKIKRGELLKMYREN